VASWLIFRVAHSLRIDLDMLVVTASPARTALKISQLTDGGMPPTYDSMHYRAFFRDGLVTGFALANFMLPLLEVY